MGASLAGWQLEFRVLLGRRRPCFSWDAPRTLASFWSLTPRGSSVRSWRLLCLVPMKCKRVGLPSWKQTWSLALGWTPA